MPRRPTHTPKPQPTTRAELRHKLIAELLEQGAQEETARERRKLQSAIDTDGITRALEWFAEELITSEQRQIAAREMIELIERFEDLELLALLAELREACVRELRSAITHVHSMSSYRTRTAVRDCARQARASWFLRFDDELGGYQAAAERLS